MMEARCPSETSVHLCQYMTLRIGRYYCAIPVDHKKYIRKYTVGQIQCSSTLKQVVLVVNTVRYRIILHTLRNESMRLVTLEITYFGM
jgi:hypothetical protein